MPHFPPKIIRREQDYSSDAWKKLCLYVEEVADRGIEEFAPRSYLGSDQFEQLITLPPSIKKLNRVKHIMLYGSSLQYLPPEIGELEHLESLDVYTSYDLRWFPYELTRCRHLKRSKVSTRALFGNHKNRKEFPALAANPVRYGDRDILHCSTCEKELTSDTTNQLWISRWVGSDVLPLLANLCSTACEEQLLKPAEGYVPYPHKGGPNLRQP